jgi:hypothetical protein
MPSHHLSGMLGFHRWRAGVQGYAALRQPYKDTGPKFGGKPVTKPTESATTRSFTRKMPPPLTYWSTIGHGIGDVVSRIASRKIICSSEATDRSCRSTATATSTPENVRIKMNVDSLTEPFVHRQIMGIALQPKYALSRIASVDR